MNGPNYNKKLYFDKHDIMEMFHCCASKAYTIIRSIKSVSDSLHIKGRVTVADFERWYNLPTVQEAFPKENK